MFSNRNLAAKIKREKKTHTYTHLKGLEKPVRIRAVGRTQQRGKGSYKAKKKGTCREQAENCSFSPFILCINEPYLVY